MLSIGFTYDLRSDYLKLGLSEEETAEFDSDETIDAIHKALTGLGHRVERIGHIQNLVAQLATGKRYDLVFNIAEGAYGIAREAQIPALLEAYQLPYTFSPPETLVICHDKSLAKQVVQQNGLATAHYQIVKSMSDIDEINLPYPLFAKPVAEGTSKGVTSQSLVHNKTELTKQCQQLLEQFNQPVLVETFLSGREFTVGLFGQGTATQVLGVLEIILNSNAEATGHTYHNKEFCESLVAYKLASDATAQQAAELAQRCWEKLGCRDAGRIDIRCDAHGTPHFIEVNPLAGLNPTRSDLILLAKQLGISHSQIIQRILENTLQRYPHLQAKVHAHSCVI